MLTHSDIAVSKLGTFTGHQGPVYTLEQSPGGCSFFSAGGDGMVVRWSLDDPNNGVPILRISRSVYALCKLSSRNELAVGHNFEGLHLVDLDAKKEIRSLKMTDSAVFSIVDYQDRLFVACGDGTVVAADRALKRIVNQVKYSDKSARTLAVHPHRGELLVGYSDFSFKILDIDTLALLHEIPAHANSVFSLSFTPDLEKLVSVGRDAHMKFWEVDRGYEPVDDIVAHGYAVNDVEFGSNRPYFATASADKTIRLWSREDHRLLKVIDHERHGGHTASVNKLLFLRDDPDMFVSCSDDRTVSVWKITIKKN